MFSKWFVFILTGLMTLECHLISASDLKLLKKFKVEPLLNSTSGETKGFSTEGTTSLSDVSRCVYPRDCRDIQKCDHEDSGVYRIFPNGGGKGFPVYCDMVTKGGGWLVFLRRQDGTEDFYRNWQSYKNGFGYLYYASLVYTLKRVYFVRQSDIQTEARGFACLRNCKIMAGKRLDKIHLLTSLRQQQLLINLGNFEGKGGYAMYQRFRVSDEQSNYKLHVEGFSGNAGDSLTYHTGYNFTTIDRDNDHYKKNCANANNGAWWYMNCHHSNLNGKYGNARGKTKSSSSLLSWKHWGYKPLQFAEMKIRPLTLQES